MGKVIKIEKRINFLVTETVKKEKSCIIQTYTFYTTNKKYLKYAFDHRFCLKRKLEKIYEKNLLKSYEFISREEKESEVIFRYRYDGLEFGNFPSKTFNCDFYLPPYNGCLYCTESRKEGDFLYCEKKKKHYDSQGIKTCPVFQSKDEIIS